MERIDNPMAQQGSDDWGAARRPIAPDPCPWCGEDLVGKGRLDAHPSCILSAYEDGELVWRSDG